MENDSVAGNISTVLLLYMNIFWIGINIDYNLYINNCPCYIVGYYSFTWHNVFILSWYLDLYSICIVSMILLIISNDVLSIWISLPNTFSTVTGLSSYLSRLGIVEGHEFDPLMVVA